MKNCPLCHHEGIRVLMGPFPVWLCPDACCSAVWGFWGRLACFLTPLLYPPPKDEDEFEGFAFVAYTGSYWRAMWHQLTGR